jgi:hypothetical protein
MPTAQSQTLMEVDSTPASDVSPWPVLNDIFQVISLESKGLGLEG